MRASADVVDRFDGKAANKAQRELQELIAEPLADAAAGKATPQLITEFATRDRSGRRDGVMTAVRAKGQIFTFHQKMDNGVLELRCYAPLSPGDFKASKLEEGGVEKLYGVKDGSDIPRITLDVGSRVRVYMWGKSQDGIDQQWARGVSEVALTMIERARAAAKSNTDAVEEIEPGVTQARSRAKPMADVLVESAQKAKVEKLGIPGHDLEGAVSWRGQPLLVTSDRGGDQNVHVLLERTIDGTTALWPIDTPSDSAFPKKGASVVLDGDTLHLFGGVDAEGKTSTAHWTLDLAKGSREGFDITKWRQAAPLKEPGAWAAAAVDDRDAFVVGGIAGYYLRRTSTDDGKGADEKVQQTRRSMQVGGFPSWRERSAPPADPTGASTLVDSSAVFVGPGVAKDGAVSVYDTKEQGWFALPNLPAKVGQGQLLKSGNELAYSGGFFADKTPSTAIYTLNLDDVFAGWQKKGDSDAVAGGARVVDRGGKKVAFMVAPKGALMVHLE